jgi:hypothetical protein
MRYQKSSQLEAAPALEPLEEELMLVKEAAGVSGLGNKGSAAGLARSASLQFGVQQTLPHLL